MFPWVYEFHWTPFHLIFLGVFFTIMVVVAATFVKAVYRTRRDFATRRSEKVMWEAAFGDLSPAARACRHALTGEMLNRVCPNEFECRRCETHQRLLGAEGRTLSAGTPSREVAQVGGFEMPLDRYYHRGHSWARPEPDGTITVGLDSLGARLAGPSVEVDLPPLGSRLEANGTAWRFGRNGTSVRVLSPVEGEVVGRGGPDEGWYLRVKPQRFDAGHLLRGGEVRPWMLRELERLQQSLSTSGVGETLADGGTLVDDLPSVLAKDIDLVRAEMFLEP